MLTDGQIGEIKWRYELGVSQTRIAKDFGVTQGTINQLVKRGFVNKSHTLKRRAVNDVQNSLVLAARVDLSQLAGGDGTYQKYLQKYGQEIALEIGAKFVPGRAGRGGSGYWEAVQAVTQADYYVRERRDHV